MRWFAALLVVAGCKFPELSRRADGGEIDDAPDEDTMMGSDAMPDMMMVCTTPMTTIASNHGHTLVVPLADVAAMVEKTYDIQGAGSHAHALTISAAQYGEIDAGQSVMITSTLTQGHAHLITVSCTQ